MNKRLFIAIFVGSGIVVILIIALTVLNFSRQDDIKKSLSISPTPPIKITETAQRIESISPQPEKTLIKVIQKTKTLPLNSSLIETKYFQENTWAVGKSAPKDSSTDPAISVFKFVNGGWIIAEGPGTEFDSSIKNAVPAEVYVYLKSQGYVAE